MSTKNDGIYSKNYVITTKDNEVLLTEDKNLYLLLKDTNIMAFYMKIYWTNGRVDIVPLMNDELVDIKKSISKLEYTITLRSGASNAENMADIIHIHKKD